MATIEDGGSFCLVNEAKTKEMCSLGHYEKLKADTIKKDEQDASGENIVYTTAAADDTFKKGEDLEESSNDPEDKSPLFSSIGAKKACYHQKFEEIDFNKEMASFRLNKTDVERKMAEFDARLNRMAAVNSKTYEEFRYIQYQNQQEIGKIYDYLNMKMQMFEESLGAYNVSIASVQDKLSNHTEMLREIYGRISVLEERNTASLAISKHLSKRLQTLEEQFQQIKMYAESMELHLLIPHQPNLKTHDVTPPPLHHNMATPPHTAWPHLHHQNQPVIQQQQQAAREIPREIPPCKLAAPPPCSGCGHMAGSTETSTNVYERLQYQPTGEANGVEKPWYRTRDVQ